MVGRVGGGVRIRPAIELPPEFAAEMGRQGLSCNAVSATECVMRALLAICRREGRPATRREIVHEISVPDRTALSALRRLVLEGRVLAAPDPRNQSWQLYIPKGGGK